MEGKREVHPLLRRVLDWDVSYSKTLITHAINIAGPINKYSTSFKALEISGHGILWMCGCVAAMFMSANITVRYVTVNIFLALLVDIVVVGVIKAVVRRRRPVPFMGDPFTIKAVDKFSFPSGHATRVTMIASLCSAQFEVGFVLESLMYTWVLSVCASRFLQRKHHLLDVVAGIVIGWLESLFVMLVLWMSVDSTNAVVAYFLDETYAGASFDV